MKAVCLRPLPRAILATTTLAFAACAHAQIRPPQAQAWIDVATFSGMGMPSGMGGAGGGGMAALGAMFGGGGGGGGGKDGNRFANTQTGGAGRWVDVTLYTRANPSLSEAQQEVPPAFLSPALKLESPKQTRGRVPDNDETVVEHDTERPKGRMLLYWGCDSAVRAGQPKVLDMATASAADLGRFFVARRATQRGTHAAVGRPVWPSLADTRMVPSDASLVGEHSFSGSGVPDGFRFQIRAAQDLMPALNLKTKGDGGATQLAWTAAPTARAYFASAMSSNEREEMVLWTSSELPDMGMALIDYQTNVAVDRWLREKVLLSPSTTTCTVPKDVLGKEGGMLRLIAYGSEMNLVHPPRPKDPKAPWEPVWAVKIRVKSVATAVSGMEDADEAPAAPGSDNTAPARPGRDDGAPSPQGSEPPPQPAGPEVNPLKILRGIFGR